MEVKPGYKQTEVGVIPEDWEVEQLGELVDNPLSAVATTQSNRYRSGICDGQTLGLSTDYGRI